MRRLYFLHIYPIILHLFGNDISEVTANENSRNYRRVVGNRTGVRA